MEKKILNLGCHNMSLHNNLINTCTVFKYYNSVDDFLKYDAKFSFSQSSLVVIACFKSRQK